MIPSKEKIEEIIKELQKILRIQDWDISIEILSGRDLQNKGFNDIDCNTLGVAERNIKLNEATIYLNKENQGNRENEWYETLLHELFHIQSTSLVYTATAYFEKEHNYFDTIYESYVERLAKMFCSIYPMTNFIKEGE